MRKHINNNLTEEEKAVLLCLLYPRAGSKSQINQWQQTKVDRIAAPLKEFIQTLQDSTKTNDSGTAATAKLHAGVTKVKKPEQVGDGTLASRNKALRATAEAEVYNKFLVLRDALAEDPNIRQGDSVERTKEVLQTKYDYSHCKVALRTGHIVVMPESRRKYSRQTDIIPPGGGLRGR